MKDYNKEIVSVEKGELTSSYLNFKQEVLLEVDSDMRKSLQDYYQRNYKVRDLTVCDMLEGMKGYVQNSAVVVMLDNAIEVLKWEYLDE